MVAYQGSGHSVCEVDLSVEENLEGKRPPEVKDTLAVFCI